MTSREIITLQFGNLANHAGSHFWNLEWNNSRLNLLNNNNNDIQLKNNINNHDNIQSSNPYKNNKHKLKFKGNNNNNDNNNNNEMKRNIVNNSNANINPNICFYAPQNSKNKYTPRTIIFGQSGSEGNLLEYQMLLNKNNNNNDNNTQNSKSKKPKIPSTWNPNKISIIDQRNDYHYETKQNVTQNNNNNNDNNNSDSNIKDKSINYKYFTSFLDVNLHRKSLFMLPGIHNNVTPFHLYETGYDLLNSKSNSSKELSEDIYDVIRYFVEKCDNMQGFQILSSHHNSFAGFIPNIMIHLNDEYSNKTKLIYDLQKNDYDFDNIDNKTSKIILKKRFELNNILAMCNIYDEINNIIPIKLNKERNIKMDASIMGTIIHHYTNTTRLYNSNVQLNDIINSVVISNSLKLSMLSSNSTHLDMDMNYQAINSIQKLFYNDPRNATKKDRNSITPVFNRLTNLSPINDEFILKKDGWKRGELFGEYTCINGTSLYNNENSNDIIKMYNNKSNQDIMSKLNEFNYKTHLKLMTKLTQNLPETTSHLIPTPWELSKKHPFYMNNKPNNISNNKYSIWTSSWSADIIGNKYLNSCAKSIEKVMNRNVSIKMFGNVELDLETHKERLYGLSDSYSPL